MKRFIFICLLTAVLGFAQAQNITRIEYAIDTDPGFGLATTVSITPGNNITQVSNLNFTGLTEGVHMLYFRAMDDSSRWSNTIVKPVYADNFVPVHSVMAEYFIDSDPGFGNGTAVAITPGIQPVKIFSLDLNGVAMGMHVLYVRVKDLDNQWSLTNSKLFFCEGAPSGNIAQVEYFFDDDPGFGNGITANVIPGQQVSLVFDVNTSGLSGGTHRVYFRTRDENGNWSITGSEWFTLIGTKIYLEGLYESSLGEMRKAQDENGDHFTGTVADTIAIKAAEASFPYTIAGAKHGIPLNQDGTSQFVMNRVPEGDYYLVVNHRNSVETWSALPVNLNIGYATYDFTDSVNKAYGDNLKQIGTDYVIYAGEVNQDGFVDGLDLLQTDNDNQQFVMGYQSTDVNGDGFVDGLDLLLIDNNNVAFVMRVAP